MSIIVYNEVETPIIPAGDLAGPVRDALGGALRSMRYVTPDFAGLYQDASGTTPVTAAGQPVGLMLDRRFGLARGEELAEDPDCITGEGWSTSTLVVHEPGKFLFPGGASSSLILRNENIQLGRYYAVEVVCEFSQDVSLRFSGRVSTEVAVIGSGTTNLVVPALGDGEIRILAVQFTTGYVSRFSVRELPGNHASQTTTTARPTLRSGPLRIDYDGVDDYLRTAFPDLGSDVTIARSIPGVGAQILTGQTIAAGNWDDNVTSCATLVIDRALTGPETALVTAFLNQQAGV